MVIRLNKLRKFIREAVKIGASPSYMKKERTRERLQRLVADQVAEGEVVDQASLDQFMNDVDMSLKALKMIPFEVWSKLSPKKPKG